MSGLADTVPADRHPKSCSRWFASDATTDEAICDCGLAEETTVAGLYRDARRLVKEHIYDPEETRLVYKGKTEAWLDSEHEGWCDEKCPSNRHLLAWHFVEVER